MVEEEAEEQMKWMPHYWAQVRVLNVKTQKEEWEWMAFHLPHEIVQVLQQTSVLEKLLEPDGMGPCIIDALGFM